jgi:hypothetical protein
MTWDRTVRLVAWVCFGLMWIALAVFILHHPAGAPADQVMLPVFAFLGLLAAFIILFLISFLGPFAVSWRESRFVRKYGTLVPAVTRDLTDTGIYLNHQPVLDIALEVYPPGGPAFEATVRRRIPYSSIPQLQPGSELQVWYIPGTTRVAMQE